MANVYYTGIGSRETPLAVQETMAKIAQELGAAGYVLRSGGANGADTAFELGAKRSNAKMEIVLPWNGFNKRYIDNVNYFVHGYCPWAEQAAAAIHPNWSACSEAVRKLHTRNMLQLVDKEVKNPSKFVICWTKDGKASGGTGQAIRFAEALEIPVFNLKNQDALVRLIDFVKTKGWLKNAA